jgi:N-acetylmuramoyl-L-alanine amidase
MKKILFTLLLILAPVFSIHAATQPIKILIVPGHDNEVWGTQYGNLKEADMNLVLATQIYNNLKKDKRFKVYITRNKTGYTKEFADYFTNHRDEIKTFKDSAKQAMAAKVADGDFTVKESVPHHNVSEDVSLRLYGFNKWADENKMDAVIHVHFNDYPRSQKWEIGKYTGFTVYVPDGELPNGKTSFPLASSIYDQMYTKYKISDYEKEAGGLKFDQTLIAMGANDTLSPGVRSVLVEYGYIYEKKFRKSTTRHQAYKTMSSLTATGIKEYFFGK